MRKRKPKTDLERAVLALPVEAKCALIRVLDESLTSPMTPEQEAAVFELLEARPAEAEADPSSLETEEDVAAVLAKYGVRSMRD